MVLHGERRQRLVADAFNRAIVQIDMRDFQIVAQRIGHDRDVVVLRCNFNRVGQQIFDRMVAAMMTEMKPPRACSASQPKYLMPKAYAHDRNLAKQFFHTIDNAHNAVWIAWPVGEQNAVRP